MGEQPPRVVLRQAPSSVPTMGYASHNEVVRQTLDPPELNRSCLGRSFCVTSVHTYGKGFVGEVDTGGGVGSFRLHRRDG